jgi:hypothetical protein
MPTVNFSMGGQEYSIDAGPNFMSLSPEEQKKKLRALVLEKSSGTTPTGNVADATQATTQPTDKDRMSKSDALWFAGKMGFWDTARGMGQILNIREDEMAEKQRQLNDLMDDSEYGNAVMAAYFGGMVADPVGWALPLTKIGKLWKGGKMGLKALTKAGLISGGTVGALGYVDPEARSILGEGEMSRGEQALFGAGAGAVMAPALGSVSKIWDNKVGDAAWRALSTRPEAGGATAGALAGYNVDMDATPMSKMRNALIGATVGGAGLKGLAKADKDLWDNVLARSFIPDWNLSDEYVARRGQFSGDRSVIRQEFDTLVERIAGEPEDVRQALYKMLTDPDAPRSKSLEGISGETRDLVTKYGEELTDLGVLNRDTFLKNVDTYLHRTYKRPKKDRFLSTDAKIRTIGDELRMRGIKKTIDKAKWDSGYRPDKDGPWEILEVKGGKVSVRRDYTPAERAQMGEVTDAALALNRTGLLMSNDISAYRFFRDVARNPDIASAEQVGKFTHKIPETSLTGIAGGPKKFGDLNGKYVTKEVHDDLMRVTQLKDKSALDNKLWRAYKKLNSIWKVSKTALNPAVHMNNIVSNVHLYDFYDGSVKHLAKSFGDIKGKSKAYKEALQNGVFGVDFIGHEIGPAFRVVDDAYKNTSGAVDALGWAEKFAPKIALKMARGTKKWTVDKMMRAYMLEDHIFRMGLYKTVKERLMKDGLGEAEAISIAARKAREGFVDYSRTTPALELMRNGPLPFISYMYGVVPRLAETAAKKPMKLAKWGLIWHGLNEMGEDMSDQSQEEIDYQRKVMPEYQRRQILGVPGMPSATLKLPDFASPKTGDDWYLDIGRMIPGGDIFGQTEGRVGQIPYVPQALQPSFGAGGAIYNTLMGIDPFRGREIPSGERPQHLLRQFTPNIAIPGLPTYAGEKIKRAMTGQPQMLKDEHTVPTAVMSGFGIKATPVSTGKSVQRLRLKLDQNLRDIDRKVQKLGRDITSGDIDRVKYSNEYKKLMKEKQKLMKEFGERVKR